MELGLFALRERPKDVNASKLVLNKAHDLISEGDITKGEYKKIYDLTITNLSTQSKEFRLAEFFHDTILGDPLSKNDFAKSLQENLSFEPASIDLEGVGLFIKYIVERQKGCLLYTSPSPRDKRQSRMPSSA